MIRRIYLKMTGPQILASVSSMLCLLLPCLAGLTPEERETLLKTESAGEMADILMKTGILQRETDSVSERAAGGFTKSSSGNNQPE